MMELVARFRHVGLSDDTAVAFRFGVDVNDADRIGRARALWIDQRQVGQLFRW